jgi:hypothetical protein
MWEGRGKVDGGHGKEIFLYVGRKSKGESYLYVGWEEAMGN